LNELLRRYPQETIVHHVLGHLESARESWRAAIDAYERARATGGENPDLDEGIASALIELEEFDAAAKVLERCKSNFPAYTEILFQEIRHSARNSRSTPESLDPLIAEYERRTRRIDRLVEVAQIAAAQWGNAPAR
jgi:predicted Zn-dependent protease